MSDSNSKKKLKLNKNVLEASEERIGWVFDTFNRICVSFFGGKDSTVMLHLTANEARKRKRSFSVLFIDWEAQFQYTISHIEKIKDQYSDVIEKFYWVALPISTLNAVSQIQPEWVAWQQDVEWVRSPPKGAITDPEYFPFYKAMYDI